METAESLKRKIGVAEDLKSVTRTMKALAAASIRQYERAVEALADYSYAIETGLQIVLRGRRDNVLKAKAAPRSRPIAVVMGSEQGMCGQINEQIVSYARDALSELNNEADQLVVLAVGMRAASLLDESGIAVQEVFSVPGSVSGLVPLVQDLLTKIEELRTRLKLDQVIVFHNRHVSNTTFFPHKKQLLPIDLEWLRELQSREWRCRTLPMFTMDWDRLFSDLIWHYLFTSVYRALAESLASENAARLAAMARANKNIEERLEELNLLYHQSRQTSITEELLDIVSGFEALTSKHA
ncbi:MAG: F0F1 ATP synthase subunit gamma [Desulfomonile tiedjei]|nr:F0F1 ATP synthase subunit gamma [Desulfomonile tiedjei]